jgi:hypothetical protein
MTDSAPKAGPKTAPVTIQGRTISVTPPTETQLTLMHRYGTISTKSLAKAIQAQEAAEALADPAERAAAEEAATPDFTTGLGSISEMLEILEFLVGEDDRAFLIQEMKTGRVGIEDLFAFFDVFKKKGTTGAKKAVRVA